MWHELYQPKVRQNRAEPLQEDWAVHMRHKLYEQVATIVKSEYGDLTVAKTLAPHRLTHVPIRLLLLLASRQ